MENLLNASYALLQSLHIVKATPPPVTDTPALETTIVPATTPAHYLRAGLNDQVPRVHDQRVDGACQEQKAPARIHDQNLIGPSSKMTDTGLGKIDQ